MNENNKPNSPFRPLSSKRVFEQVAEQIRQLIFSGVFKPADKLPPEMELAGHFNVGRTALREALRVLENEGLIYVKQGSDGGSFIAEPDILTSPRSIIERLRMGEIDVQSLYEIRLNIEPQMLKYVIDRMTKEDLDAMEKTITDAEETMKTKNGAFTRFSSFHLLIARASRNPIYEMLLASMINLSVHLLAMGPHRQDYFQLYLDQHREIFECLRGRDLKKSQRALEKHIHQIIRNIKVVRNNSK